MARLTILSDDITGCVDSGALLCSAGCSVRVYTSPTQLKKEVPEEDVLSINLSSRTLEGAQAQALFWEAGKQLLATTSDLVMKKLDTGFRGNAVQEIDGLMKALDRRCCFLVAHAPWRNIYTLNGNQYFEGTLLSHSRVAKEDPLKRPSESNLVRILSEHTSLALGTIGLMDVRRNNLRTRVEESLEKGAQILIFDAITPEDGVKIVAELWKPFPNTIWAGSGGLAWGFAKAVFGRSPKWGPVEQLGKRPCCVCFSASAYSTTRRQIDLAKKLRLVEEVTVNIKNFFVNGEIEIKRVVTSVIRLNQSGRNVILTPNVLDTTDIKNLPHIILQAISLSAKEVCEQANFDRIVIIGGETAQSIFSILNIHTLTVTQKPETGIGAGKIVGTNFSGKSFALKGGVCGSPYALCRMLGIAPEAEREGHYDDK